MAAAAETLAEYYRTDPEMQEWQALDSEDFYDLEETMRCNTRLASEDAKKIPLRGTGKDYSDEFLNPAMRFCSVCAD